MESFLLKLAVAVLPLIFLIASIIIYTGLSSRHTRRSLSRHRNRRSIRRALTAGTVIH